MLTEAKKEEESKQGSTAATGTVAILVGAATVAAAATRTALPPRRDPRAHVPPGGPELSRSTNVLAYNNSVNDRA
jgi:hypothetical protein